MNDQPQDALALDAVVAAGCQEPGCARKDHALVLAQRCHRGAGTDVLYTEGANVLTILCHKCRAVVARVLVGVRS